MTGSIFCRLAEQNIYKVLGLILILVGSCSWSSGVVILELFPILLHLQKLVKHVVHLCLHLLHVLVETCRLRDPRQPWDVIANADHSC